MYGEWVRERYGGHQKESRGDAHYYVVVTPSCKRTQKLSGFGIIPWKSTKVAKLLLEILLDYFGGK